MTFLNDETALRYRVGIDVGTHSTGFFAAEVDDADFPIRILNAMVLVHDSGVDPGSQKQAMTRLAVAGIKRRSRRMFRRRKQRLLQLDEWITEQGWPLVDLEEESNPYFPWIARARLASEQILDPELLAKYLSASLRHMARHRGWRNPYSTVKSLFTEVPPSPQMSALAVRVAEKTGRALTGLETPAQLIVFLGLEPSVKLRGPSGILGGKLMQSDNAAELRTIAAVQGIEEDALREMIEMVFHAESPRGSAAARVGKDALPGQTHLRRATKADEVFQEFRIASVVANLRLKESDITRRLNASEQRAVIEYLMRGAELKRRVTWNDIAELLGVSRDDLKGTAAAGPDGERPSSSPPTNVTDARIRALKIPAIVNWWELADPRERSVLVSELSNAGDDPESEEALIEVGNLIEKLSDTDLEKLSTLVLPAGRAAYSRDSLTRLTRRMLDDGVDLYEARVAEFGVAPDWIPPADPIGAQVGNPAVDRVTKQVSRWLNSVEREWGMPLSVNIEHVRSALGSEAVAREIDRTNNKRYQRNQAVYDEMHARVGLSGKARRSDLTRYLALQRQNGQCAYCGSAIDFQNAEMDHIVPRAGEGGARNTRDNLVAVCERCNKSKSNQPFGSWAPQSGIPGVSLSEAISRVRHWIADPHTSARENAGFKQSVIERLRRTSQDAPIDERSMESVAWMANELHSRVKHHYRQQGANTSVAVYRGSITAEARRASGLEGRINMIGGRGKTRLDRRHHAVDAATVALMRPSVAKTLTQRSNLRVSQQMTSADETWKSYLGDSLSARSIYGAWQKQMLLLSELINLALVENEIPVVQNLRLRLGNSAVHEDTINKLVQKPLASQLSTVEIDRSATPAQWCALTRNLSFDTKTGLPADAGREITVNGRHVGPLDPVQFFASGAASVKVRGGYAELGNAMHHARIFRINGKRPVFAMLRVYTIDLVRFSGQDLFTAELVPQTISMRTAEPRLRRALEADDVEYLGWLVIGDELQITPSQSAKGQVGTFLAEYPSIEAWRVDGFYSPSRLRLRPVLLASEGLADNAEADIRKIVDKPGWLPSVNVVFGGSGATVVRRSALGVERWGSRAGLPTCWTTCENMGPK